MPRLLAAALACSLSLAGMVMPMARAAENADAPVVYDLDTLKSTADDLYIQRHYRKAVPLYQKIVDLMIAQNFSSAREAAAAKDQVCPYLTKAQDDLADALCQTGQFSQARSIYETHLKALGILTTQMLKDNRAERKNEKRRRPHFLKHAPEKSEAADALAPFVSSQLALRPSLKEAKTGKNDVETAKKRFYLTEIAATYFREGSYNEAEKLLYAAMNMANDEHLEADEKLNARTMLSIYLGETLYRQRRFEDAVKVFGAALDGVQKSKNVSYEVSKTLLASLAGTYDSLKQFHKSVPVYRTMAVLDRTYFGDTDINYGWSLLELSDALKAEGKPEEAEPIFEKSVWIFRDNNYLRLAEKYHLTKEDLKKAASDPAVSPEELAKKKELAVTLRKNVFGLGLNPDYENGDRNLVPPGAEIAAGFDHCQAPKRGMLGAWNVRPDKHIEAPGWVWTDPTVDQKALMLCVHGLGLHHRAFESFAERVVSQGFTVVSFDVRGFGAYVQAKGHDHLDMKACVADLIRIIAQMRRDYPDRRVFLLGESMGGALALRVAAEQPGLIDGLVCSVPSAERHKETKTKLEVALKFLTFSKKDVNLAQSVVDKSINDAHERAEWRTDPRARLRLSPRELLEFDLFMRQNKTYAAKVDQTPVLVFQGTSDRLVKEKGTESLFRALPTKDKALVLMGNQEHLIFEANPYKDDLTLGIIGWLNAHALASKQTASKQN